MLRDLPQNLLARRRHVARCDRKPCAMARRTAFRGRSLRNPSGCSHAWERDPAGFPSAREPSPPRRAPFISGLPEHGIWTAVGLSRGQFFGILLVSIGLFLLVGGPLWMHLREGHFARLA
jgi:hypothetical protein